MSEPQHRRQHFRVPITHDHQLRSKMWRITIDRPFTRRVPYDAFPVTVLNVSEGGMLFAVEYQSFRFGSRFGISLERESTHLMVQGEVRHLQEAPQTPTKVGIQFLFDERNPNDSRAQQAIAHLVAAVQKDQLQRLASYRGGPPSGNAERPENERP